MQQNIKREFWLLNTGRNLLCLHHDTKKLKRNHVHTNLSHAKKKTFDLIKSRACKNLIEKREDIKF